MVLVYVLVVQKAIRLALTASQSFQELGQRHQQGYGQHEDDDEDPKNGSC